MFLSTVSIKRPVLTTVMSLALVIFGLIGLTRLPVRELPNIDPPIINVTTVYPGASAHVIETEVTERLEEELNSIEGIKTMTSESREQVSAVTLEFDLSRHIELAAQDVRDRVARVRGRLPPDIEEPVVAKQEADAQPVIWIAVNSERHTMLELSTLAENTLKDRLQTAPGVSSVILGGQKRFAIRIWLDTEKMAARRVTVQDVESALREQNVELPSGRIESWQRELTIQTRGQLRTAEEFNQLVIFQDRENFVRLEDIGTAAVGAEDERTIARANGLAAVGLGVVKQSTANTIEVARAIKAELDRMRPDLPAGVVTTVVYDESTYIEHAITEVWLHLGMASLLVILTIFVFLRNVRSTIIPSIAIPVSIIGTFAVLHLFGYSVNILTMLAFVLAIGIVVDDAIVVLENIHRHMEAGEPPMRAAFKAMDEIAFAIIAITLSLVVVFLPLAFQTSTTGRLFVEFAVAVAGAVIISGFVALSLTPMMCARILKPVHSEKHGRLFNLFERGFQRLNHRYERILLWSLGHRRAIILVALGTLALTVVSYRALDKEFLPEEDKGRLLNIVIAPEGSTSEYTDRMMRAMEGIVEEAPEVENYFTAVALAQAGPGNAARGFMFMTFKEDRDRSVQDIVGGPSGLGARFFNEIEGAIAIPIIPKAIGRSFSQPFQLVLQNQDLDELERYAGELVNNLRAAGFLANTRSMYEVTKPELRVTIDRNRAATLGISVRDISRTLQILFGGLDISKINLGGKEYDVIAQLDRENRLNPGDLDRVYVRNNAGQLVQLSNVVETGIGAGPSSIWHYNRLRNTVIEATPVGMTLGTAMERVEQILRNDMPSGFRYEWAGESRDMKDSSGEVFFVLILAIVIVYLVLAAQFESWVHPFTVMLSLPLAAFGAFGLLWILAQVNGLGTMLHGWVHYGGDAPGWARILNAMVPRIPAMNINLFSQIGLVMLLGLVTKNSILLVEFANQQMTKGLNAREAMKLSGMVRLRPILMTSFAMIFGLLPIALGFGAGAETRRPLGMAVIGGMFTSTFLTLVIIPVVYTLFDDLSRKLGPKRVVPPEAQIEAAAESARSRYSGPSMSSPPTR
jgi:multidrug efflux pump